MGYVRVTTVVRDGGNWTPLLLTIVGLVVVVISLPVIAAAFAALALIMFWFTVIIGVLGSIYLVKTVLNIAQFLFELHQDRKLDKEMALEFARTKAYFQVSDRPLYVESERVQVFEHSIKSD